MAAAAPANALVYLKFAESASGATMNWTRDADLVGGNLTAGGTVILTIFGNELTNGPLSIETNFTLTGRDDGVATKNFQDRNQWFVDGSFSFLSTSAFEYNGINYAAGTNVLSASFLDADFGGNGTVGSFKAQDGVDASVNYSSSVLTQQAAYTLDTFVFEFNGNNTGQPFAATGCPVADTGVCTTSLRNIGGGVRGSFSAAVPEPGTWALMILGFGGAGAMLRTRRRELTAAA